MGNMIKKKKLEIYIHIPFCIKKCNYCDFLSAPADEDTKASYMQALYREVVEYSREYSEYEVVSIFIGGGTPTVVAPEYILELMHLLQKYYNLDSNAEISLEMNPGTVNKKALEIYKSAGINRLSIGLQSANEEELKILGRIHSYKKFVETYQMARIEGFCNINVDIMSGLPKQTIQTYKETLQNVIGLEPPPEHISAYSLIIEEGTPFYKKYSENEEALMEEETERQMYCFTKEFLLENGYRQYEISNYAKQGKECKHNIGYWTNVEYVGFGIGAASMVNGCRFCVNPDIKNYIQNPLSARTEQHRLSEVERMEERMFLGLRMNIGVSEKQFLEDFGVCLDEVYKDVIDKHQKNGLLVWKEMSEEGRYLQLTDKGRDVSNYVMCDFLEPESQL